MAARPESAKQAAGGHRARRNHPLVDELLVQLSHYSRLMRLDRPIGFWLLLWPTLWGLWIAGAGRPDPVVFTIFVTGVIVMRAAGCVFNDFVDRNLDSRVLRTRDRPIASGAVRPVEALVLFVALILIAAGLALMLNRQTQLLALGGLLLVLVYPFTKRFISTPQLVLGAAFGWSIPMAFAAQTGSAPRLAWLLWLCVVIWAVIYDTMYAMVDRDDDVKAGIRSTAILFGQADLFIISVLQFTLLAALLLAGLEADLGQWYLLSLGFGALLMFYQYLLIRDRTREGCFQAFMNNHYFGATVFAGIVLDYTFAGA